jgi:hypothetical protein
MNSGPDWKDIKYRKLSIRIEVILLKNGLYKQRSEEAVTLELQLSTALANILHQGRGSGLSSRV